MIERDEKFEKSLYNFSQREFDLAREIDTVCKDLRSCLVEKHRGDHDPGSLPHNILFVRSWRLWQATMRLAGQGYAAEAEVLARSMWELSVQIGYLCQYIDQRTRQYLQYQEIFVEQELVRIADDAPDRLESFGLRRPDVAALSKRIVTFVVEFGDPKTAARISQSERDSRKVIAQFRRYRNWTLLNLREAAKTIGAELEYEVFYPRTSRSAHGGYDAVRSFTWLHEGRSVIEAGPSMRHVDQVLLLGGQFILTCVKHINTALAFDLVSKIDKLIEGLSVCLKELQPIEFKIGKSLRHRKENEGK